VIGGERFAPDSPLFAAVRAWLDAADPAEATAALHESVVRGKADRISQGLSTPPMTRPRRVC
jgi:hypothetical protein